MPPPPPRCPDRRPLGRTRPAPRGVPVARPPRGRQRRRRPGLRRTEAAGPARVPAAPRGRGGHDRAPRRRHLGRRAAAHRDGHRLRLRPQAPVGARGDLRDAEHAIVGVRPRHPGWLARRRAVRAPGRTRAAGPPCRRRGGCPPAARLGARLWRGQALDGLDGDGFIHAEQSRLESLRLTTTLGRIDADLRLGGAAEVVDELEALAREHPLDEGIRGQLMVALYRTGNQAEALAAYQDIRRALAEELGLDPSRSLQELEGAILRQDPSLDLPDARPRTRVRAPGAHGRRRRPSASSSPQTPARSSASRRSASTMRTSSSGASASCRRWSRASPSTASSGSSARRAAASRRRSGRGSCRRSRQAPSATRAGCA